MEPMRLSLRSHAVVQACVLAVVFLALTGPARADVLEIGASGTVTTYSAPAVFTAEGATPIQAAPAPRAVRAAPGEVAGLIAEASQRYAVPQSLVQAVAWQESRFNQTAVSGKGAIGVMQLMPGSARRLGVDPYDLRQNIHGGAAYLGQMLTRYNGDTGLALAAYNAGPGAVDRYGGAPPYKETRRYVADILARVSQNNPAVMISTNNVGNGSPPTLVLGR
jgi:soluble lytic murein transglycosylase-like protein